MPIYDFICEKCEKKEERLVSRANIDEQYCQCSSDAKMTRSEDVPNTSFALKGVWYKTHKRY